MLQIPCPWCGVSDETEFRYGGPSNMKRPGSDASDAEWSAYLFLRDNPKGLLRERWCHSYGCAEWFNVTRDSVTHEIHLVYRMGEAPPEPTDDPPP